MPRYLLDVNVLIALIDPAHVQHDRAHDWFAAQGRQAWSTCPLTENGVLRIVGSGRYPSSPGTPAAVAELVAILRALAHAHGGQLVTFDRQLVTDAVINGSKALHLIVSAGRVRPRSRFSDIGFALFLCSSIVRRLAHRRCSPKISRPSVTLLHHGRAA
jgi:predicted nucleic acid-binding protein